MKPSSRRNASGGSRRGGALTSVIAALALLAAVTVAGCGDDDGTSPSGSGITTGADATGPDVAGADPGDVEVIDGWISALSDGDTDAAADYFAIPSTAENGSLLTQLDSPHAVVAFNQSLPCGGKLVTARTTGDFTTATFELTDRPGGDCGTGTGTRASTAFVIESGKITDWRRVANPGDTATPGPGGEIS